MPCSMWDLNYPDQESNLYSWHWKHSLNHWTIIEVPRLSDGYSS